MAAHERSKDPLDILAEAEQQWVYTEEELRCAPSIVDGMPIEEERLLRGKANHFITQVGIMLKIPQTTLSTASIFCNRFLMRRSLVKKPGYAPLHHYQIAAISLFVATKVEEHTRKLKDLVIACVRVALKKPDMHVDEQTKDFWRWRDTIINHEDLMLEMLAFDLNIDSPYMTLFNLLKAMQLHHNKRLRDAAWSFVNDTNLTQACLLFTSQVIGATALYFGTKHCDTIGEPILLPPGPDGLPWWKAHRVRLVDVRRCMNYMADFFENSKTAPQDRPNPYASHRTPLGGSDEEEEGEVDETVLPDRRHNADESSQSPGGQKRSRAEDGAADGTHSNGDAPLNGGGKMPRLPISISRVPPEAKKRKVEYNAADAEQADGSEEGEI